MKKVFTGIGRFLGSDRYMLAGIVMALTGIFINHLLMPIPSRGMTYGIIGVFLTAYFLIGHDILAATFRNIKKGNIFDENFLMVIASIGAFILGYFTEAVAVILFYKVGEFLQEGASDKATRSIQAMLDVRPETALVVTEGGSQETEAVEVPVNTLIRIMPGDKVPLDGIIVEGSSDMNTAALTGEAAPRHVTAGDEILAGFVNGGGLLTLKTTKEFGETVFSKVIRMVKDSQQQKAETEKFITRFARYYTPIVVMLAAIVAIIPPLVLPGATYGVWVYRALVFLVISCPCALLLSVPLSFFAGLGASARNGIFVKGGQYLEGLAHAETVVFDKTGTLTTGAFEVKDIEAFEGYTETEVLRYAATAEIYSTHPVGRCLVETYKQRTGENISIQHTEYQEIPGHGVRVATSEGQIKVGKSRFVKNAGDEDAATYVMLNDKIIGRITLTDSIREGTSASIQELRREGVNKIILLSGDHEAPVQEVAQTLGIDEYSSGMLPGDKLEKLIFLLEEQPKGKKTVFVGDGINDAPSLARADIGIAMGGAGSDAALEAADIVLVEDDLSRLPLALKIARKTRTIAYQNIVGAIGIKVIIMILGTFGYTPLWLAIFADVGVALMAVMNSLRVLKI